MVHITCGALTQLGRHLVVSVTAKLILLGVLVWISGQSGVTLPLTWPAWLSRDVKEEIGNYLLISRAQNKLIYDLMINFQQNPSAPKLVQAQKACS